MHRVSSSPAVACLFIRPYICVRARVVEDIVLCRPTFLEWLLLHLLPLDPPSTPPLAKSALLPLVSVLLWRSFHPHAYVVVLPFVPSHILQSSTYRCISCLDNSEKHSSYSRPLTLTLPVTVPLQSLHPPPFSQWCDGPHCGVVVVLHSRNFFFLNFCPDAPQKDVSFPAHSLGRLTSRGGLVSNTATGVALSLQRGQSLSPQTGPSHAKNGANF